MRSFLILGSILASLVTWLFIAAPHGHAAAGPVFAVTRVEWSGSPCVQVYGASIGNPYLIGSPVWQCDGSSGPHWAEWTESRYSGQVVGIDPEMGDNDWIRCTLWINGQIAFMDFANHGDGHQVSCLKYVS